MPSLRLEFYTKQPGSSPSILVNRSKKPNIHSQKSVLRLNEGAVKEYWHSAWGCVQFIDCECDFNWACVHWPGFVLPLEVLEKPWNLILDFKGAWKALEKKNFCWKCLKIIKNPWIFARMQNNVGLYQSNSGIERRFQNQGHIISGGALLKLLLSNENISKHCARQNKLALNTPWKLSFWCLNTPWILYPKTSTDYDWRVTIWNKQTIMQNQHFSDGSCFSLIITWVIILKQLFASSSVNIGEYSPIFTSPSANKFVKYFKMARLYYLIST